MNAAQSELGTQKYKGFQQQGHYEWSRGAMSDEEEDICEVCPWSSVSSAWNVFCVLIVLNLVHWIFQNPAQDFLSFAQTFSTLLLYQSLNSVRAGCLPVLLIFLSPTVYWKEPGCGRHSINTWWMNDLCYSKKEWLLIDVFWIELKNHLITSLNHKLINSGRVSLVDRVWEQKIVLIALRGTSKRDWSGDWRGTVHFLV